MNKGTNEVMDSIQKVNSSSEKSSTILSTLETEVNNFKI